MIEEFEKYIRELPEALQEKARGIKTKEEMYAFIADSGLELPEEALKLVSGGCGSAQEVCPQCGSTNIVHETSMGSDLKVYCRNCGCILFMQPLR